MPRTPRDGRRFLVMAAALMALPAVGGCGYHLGLPGVEDGRHLAVTPFENRTLPLRRDLEVTLTRLIHEELRRLPGLVITATSTGADALLEGALVEVRESTLLETQRDQPRSLRVTVSVYAKLCDPRGARLWEGTLVEQGDTNLLGAGATVGAGTRDEAVERAFRQVARSLTFTLAQHLSGSVTAGAE